MLNTMYSTASMNQVLKYAPKKGNQQILNKVSLSVDLTFKIDSMWIDSATIIQGLESRQVDFYRVIVDGIRILIGQAMKPYQIQNPKIKFATQLYAIEGGATGTITVTNDQKRRNLRGSDPDHDFGFELQLFGIFSSAPNNIKVSVTPVVCLTCIVAGTNGKVTNEAQISTDLKRAFENKQMITAAYESACKQSSDSIIQGAMGSLVLQNAAVLNSIPVSTAVLP